MLIIIDSGISGIITIGEKSIDTVDKGDKEFIKKKC